MSKVYAVGTMPHVIDKFLMYDKSQLELEQYSDLLGNPFLDVAYKLCENSRSLPENSPNRLWIGNWYNGGAFKAYIIIINSLGDAVFNIKFNENNHTCGVYNHLSKEWHQLNYNTDECLKIYVSTANTERRNNPAFVQELLGKMIAKNNAMHDEPIVAADSIQGLCRKIGRNMFTSVVGQSVHTHFNMHSNIIDRHGIAHRGIIQSIKDRIVRSMLPYDALLALLQTSKTLDTKHIEQLPHDSQMAITNADSVLSDAVASFKLAIKPILSLINSPLHCFSIGPFGITYGRINLSNNLIILHGLNNIASMSNPDALNYLSRYEPSELFNCMVRELSNQIDNGVIKLYSSFDAMPDEIRSEAFSVLVPFKMYLMANVILNKYGLRNLSEELLKRSLIEYGLYSRLDPYMLIPTFDSDFSDCENIWAHAYGPASNGDFTRPRFFVISAA